jgi:MoxR-like ATPase/soluble cytochrome b562
MAFEFLCRRQKLRKYKSIGGNKTMPSINTSKRLMKRIALINLATPKGIALTTMLSGPHGIGKSQIVSAAAKELGGYSLIVEGGSLKEGEITGLPFASKTTDGSSEVRFVPYYQISNIQKVEKYYYEIAKNAGFLNGSVKLTDKGVFVKTGDKEKTIPLKSTVEQLIHGEINNYKFGDELPVDVKMKLIESGEVKPVILFIDELNRTDIQVMKELMNIILTRNINGYDLPWWTIVVSAVNPSSQSSVYAVNEMDDAQRDRFLKLTVDARLEEWIDYALDANLNSDVVAAIATAEDIFLKREKGHTDEEEMAPSPRSWEMVNYIYDMIHEFNESKFMTAEDKKHVNDDLRTLIAGKVGPTAARTFLQTIENKENNIKPGEILNGKSEKIDEKIVNKFLGQKKYRQKVTMDSVIRHIQNTVVDFENKKKSTKVEEKREYVNYKAQIKHFIDILDEATKLAFAKKVAQVDTVVATDGKNVFGKIADCFAQEMLKSIREFEDGLNNLERQ